MKRIILIVLAIASAVLCGPGTAMQASANTLEIRIEQVSPPGLIVVSLTNAGKAPLKLWRNGNSWGTARWRLLHVSGDGKLHTHFQNPDQIFTVNKRAFDELLPGKSLQVTLDMNDGNWLPQGEKVTFAPGDTAVAIYDVPSTEDAHSLGVWYGVTAAMKVVR